MKSILKTTESHTRRVTKTSLRKKDLWNNIDWRTLKTRVFEKQCEIYRASLEGNTKTVHKLQTALLNSENTKLLAIRKVTQENKGKKTPGVDGVKSLNLGQRMALTDHLLLDGKASAVRRVWINKPGSKRKRPLGVPTIEDRAKQALVRTVLEPEWEAKFSPKSFGFRPGRCISDAHRLIKQTLILSEKEILDAHIEKCFDRIDHKALLKKLTQDPRSKVYKQIKAWLEAGIMDGENISGNTRGTPQGGVLSPLLANIALHGLESRIKHKINVVAGKTASNGTHVYTYADDIIVLAYDLKARQIAESTMVEFLKEIGLNLSPTKTKRCQSSEGFDYLGCDIAQRPVGKYKWVRHPKKIAKWRVLITPTLKTVQNHFKEIRRTVHASADLSTLIQRLNLLVRGFKEFARKTDAGTTGQAEKWSWWLYLIVASWVKRKYKTQGRNTRVYTEYQGRTWVPYARKGKNILYLDTYYRKGDNYGINSHILVRLNKSPYDGDWIYWGTRTVGNRLSDWKLNCLKRQRGRCDICKGRFLPEDIIESDHRVPKRLGGGDGTKNLRLVHQECHEIKSRTERSRTKKTPEQPCKG